MMLEYKFDLFAGTIWAVVSASVALSLIWTFSPATDRDYNFIYYLTAGSILLVLGLPLLSLYKEKQKKEAISYYSIKVFGASALIMFYLLSFFGFWLDRVNRELKCVATYPDPATLYYEKCLRKQGL